LCLHLLCTWLQQTSFVRLQISDLIWLLFAHSRLQAVKQQRSSSASPRAAEVTGWAGGAPVPQPGIPGKTAAAPQNAVSDAELAVPAIEVLQNATVQQLMMYADNALSNALLVRMWFGLS
jgi:hypothetical protein